MSDEKKCSKFFLAFHTKSRLLIKDCIKLLRISYPTEDNNRELTCCLMFL